jgi:hypothetical protein
MITVSFEKQKLYQERARQKQIDKQNSPEHKEKILLKAKAAQERAFVKQIEKLNSNEPVLKKPKQAKKTVKPKTPIKPSTINKVNKPRKPIKSKGLVGNSRTKAEVKLHGKMAELGCICCIRKGLILPFSSAWTIIHHIDGRTSENCHLKTLPLCAWHHDSPIPKDHPLFNQYLDVIPVHAKGNTGGKVAFEIINGTQIELLSEVLTIINEHEVIKELGLSPTSKTNNL